MAINGTEFMNDPWGTAFSPFTDFFGSVIGNGQIFYLFPLVVLTMGIQIKTQNSVMTTMFMIGSGALLGTGSLFVGATPMAIMFTIYTALGFVGLFMSLLFQR